MGLKLDPHFHQAGKRHFREFSAADDFYEMLIGAHRDLDAAQSQALNARLILLLANHIGDMALLREALDLAREDS
jgi:hypothetical protein